MKTTEIVVLVLEGTSLTGETESMIYRWRKQSDNQMVSYFNHLVEIPQLSFPSLSLSVARYFKATSSTTL